MPDPLPRELVQAEKLGPFDRAIRWIHFPDSQEELGRAEERLKFDELFTLELGVAFRKHRVEATEKGVVHRCRRRARGAVLATLAFEPTGAQRPRWSEIDEAMARPRPMNLLLQGDVGSGKTLVALHAALVAVQSGHQAADHGPDRGARRTALPVDGGAARAVRRRAVPGGRPLSAAGGGRAILVARAGAREGDRCDLRGPHRERDRQGPCADPRGHRDGEVDLVVGTHALVQEGVAFHDLSLAVIDEQHRFGVHQRMALKGKGGSPDVLIMTATPIPRTLALTYYGDLDVVVLDEMPEGRRPIETRVARTDAERESAYELVRREVEAGRQAFVVCAAIDETNKAEVKAAEAEAERLATKVFPELSVEVLHGRMRPAEKERVMERFRSGRHHVLISTTVIEVGVDVPNATVMLVENAERFGLAQLHQLRGRIGRGGWPSLLRAVRRI